MSVALVLFCCSVQAKAGTLICMWVKTFSHYFYIEGLCPSDILLPHPDDCSKFIVCVGSKEYDRDCPSGLYFDPNIQTCDWPQHVDCEELEDTNYNWTTAFEKC